MSATPHPLKTDKTSDERRNSAATTDAAVPAFVTREWIPDDGIPTEPPFYHEADEGTWARRINPALKTPLDDERVIRRLYIDDDLSDRAIGRVLGTTGWQVRKRRNRFDIVTTNPSTYDRGEYPVAENHDLLYELYVVERLTLPEIAELPETRASLKKVYTEWQKAGIDEETTARRRGQCNREISRSITGREYAGYRVGSEAEDAPPMRYVSEHALAALAAGHDPYDVFGGSSTWLEAARAAGTPDVTVEADPDATGIDNHHDNRMTLDNRPTNIQPLPDAEHTKIHAADKHVDFVFQDAEQIRRDGRGEVDEKGRAIIPVDQWGTPLACPIIHAVEDVSSTLDAAADDPAERSEPVAAD